MILFYVDPVTNCFTLVAMMCFMANLYWWWLNLSDCPRRKKLQLSWLFGFWQKWFPSYLLIYLTTMIHKLICLTVMINLEHLKIMTQKHFVHFFDELMNWKTELLLHSMSCYLQFIMDKTSHLTTICAFPGHLSKAGIGQNMSHGLGDFA